MESFSLDTGRDHLLFGRSRKTVSLTPTEVHILIDVSVLPTVQHMTCI